MFQGQLDKINNRQALVGVIGLGYVGLPLVRIFAKAGFRVLGFDCDQNKITALSRGESYIKHIDSDLIKEMVQSGRFEATSDMSRLREPDAILICVPTPLTANREPDMSFVVSTVEDIRGALRKGQLVILESTTYPGTTRDLMKPILEKSGLKAGDDFFLAFSPEREDPGNPNHSAANIPKVVGGFNAESLQLASALYSAIVPRVVPVSSCEVAEASKILENTYRCVNIALVNELKMLFQRMGIDVWEVISAASSKPFGFQPFYPGPGLGGHCIPIDPFYLSWAARKYHFATRFIELAGEVNSQMPDFVVDRVLLALNSVQKAINGSKILILGMAYKKDVDDPRESPSFELMEKLEKLGANVVYNDPHIPKLKRMRKYDFSDEVSQALTPELLASQDLVLIATDHSAYDWSFIGKHAKLIIDSRNAMRSQPEFVGKIWPA